MRLPVRFSASIVAVAILALCAGARTEAQDTAGQSSSSQSLPPQSTPDQPSLNGTYIAIDPLALVRYDNRFDISLGMAYDHMKAGPNLLQGSNLGGLDLSGTRSEEHTSELQSLR